MPLSCALPHSESCLQTNRQQRWKCASCVVCSQMPISRVDGESSSKLAVDALWMNRWKSYVCRRACVETTVGHRHHPACIWWGWTSPPASCSLLCRCSGMYCWSTTEVDRKSKATEGYLHMDSWVCLLGRRKHIDRWKWLIFIYKYVG